MLVRFRVVCLHSRASISLKLSSQGQLLRLPMVARASAHPDQPKSYASGACGPELPYALIFLYVMLQGCMFAGKIL